MAISWGGPTCNGRMFWHLILTDACNLCCSYCRGKAFWPREEPARPVAYDPTLPAELAVDLDDLAAFLARDPDPTLTFYGGEPLLRPDLVEDVMARLPDCRFMLQTNGAPARPAPPRDPAPVPHPARLDRRARGPDRPPPRRGGLRPRPRERRAARRGRVPGRADCPHDRGRGHGDRGGRAPLRRSARLGGPLAARRELLGRPRRRGTSRAGRGSPTTRGYGDSSTPGWPGWRRGRWPGGIRSSTRRGTSSAASPPASAADRGTPTTRSRPTATIVPCPIMTGMTGFYLGHIRDADPLAIPEVPVERLRRLRHSPPSAAAAASTPRSPSPGPPPAGPRSAARSGTSTTPSSAPCRGSARSSRTARSRPRTSPTSSSTAARSSPDGPVQ